MAWDNQTEQSHLGQLGRKFEWDSPSVLTVRLQRQESSIGHTDREPQCGIDKERQLVDWVDRKRRSHAPQSFPGIQVPESNGPSQWEQGCAVTAAVE